MINERQYVHWMGKAKNGSVEPDQASKDWNDLYNAPGAVTDVLGGTPKYARRVAVKKADIVRHVDESETKRTQSIIGRENKKASMEDVAAELTKFSKGTFMHENNQQENTWLIQELQKM